MIRTKSAAFLLTAVVLASPLMAAEPATNERLSYSWRLKGGISWLARLAFPSSGRGTLETRQAGLVNSRLTINADDSKGYYLYESQMEAEGTKTLTSRNAYAYGSSARDERVAFDVPNRLTHVQKTTADGSETKTRRLESVAPQDVLTSIYYLRQHADEIRTPKHAEIYSGANAYDVLYIPLQASTMRVGGKDVRVRQFSIKPVGDDAHKFPGAVQVWLTDDDRALPARIDIEQKYATLKLNLD